MASVHRSALVHVTSIGEHVGSLFTRRAFLLQTSLSLLAGSVSCGGAPATSRVALPPPSERNMLGPGDVFSVEIVGEKDLPREYQIASDGTVELPYIHTLTVTGLEGPQVARLIRKRLIEEKILKDPSVVVQVKEYNSRRITLLGQVAKPGTFPFTPGLTLVGAVSLAGGLTAIAKSSRVVLTRKLETGGLRTVEINADPIIQGRAPDIPLQSGDRIFVDERLF